MDQSVRQFGLPTATAMIVGGMIGGGIFVIPGILAPLGWTSVVSWVVVGMGTLSIAGVISALVVKSPDEPSTLTICGDILGLLPGRLMVWAAWIAIVCIQPPLSITAAAYLLHLFPTVPQGQLQQVLGGAMILTLVIIVNLRGTREAGNFQVATTVLKLVPLAVVIAILGYLFVSAPQAYTETQIAPFSASELTPALAITFYAMVGFENAGLIAGRVRDPARNVVRATLLGLTLVLAIYLVVSTGIIMTTPAALLASTSAPVAVFVARYMGTWAGDGVALFAAISAIGALNCTVFMMGEVPLGMVRDGQLPHWMAPMNTRGVASRPLLAGFALGLALMLFSVTGVGERILDFFLRLTTASAMWCYIGVAAAGLIVKAKPVLAAISIVFSLWVLYGTGAEAGLLGFALLLAGLPLHFLLGGRLRERFTAPAQ